MTALRLLAARLKAYLTKSRRDAELDEEIAGHLDLLTDEYVRRGLPLAEARTAARRAFGGVEPMKEAHRDQRGLPFVDALARDLQYGGRMLRRHPGFTAVAILSLGLGIGAATAAFSVWNAVMLRQLPVADPQQLVILQPERRGERWILFNPTFEELRRHQQGLSGIFAASDDPYLKVVWSGAAAPTYVRASLVSGEYFSVLGLQPSRGRLLSRDDDELPGAAGSSGCAAVVSHRFWRRHLQAEPNVIGRTLRARETECTVVGVAREGFEGVQAGYVPDIWLPLRRLTDRKLLASRSMAFFSGVMGRRRPGVTLRQAEAELTALYQRIETAEHSPLRMTLLPGAQGLDGVRRWFGEPLTMILILVGVVLLIAALNVTTLLLARGAARVTELATRAALGAGRGRLVRQLATEGGLLAVLGGAVGAALAWLTTPALGALISEAIDTAPDHRVIAVATAVTALVALLAGVLPAVRLSGATLRAGMAASDRSATPRGGLRLIRGLVVAQLAFSLVLVSAAALLLHTMVRIARIDPGFRPDHVVVLGVADETPGSSWNTPDSTPQKARRAATYRLAEERLRGLPGVRAASLSWLGLFGGSDQSVGLIDPDHSDESFSGRVDYVSPGYFDAVGMSILRGRGFDDADREGTARVAVVNETLARERFRGEALGRRLAGDYPPDELARPFTIVGVVRDSKYNDRREDRAQAMMWMPLAQAPYRIRSVALRVEPGFESAVARQAEAALASTDPHLMVRKATTLSAQVDQTTARERMLLGLASGFGALALLLAAVGLYGTLSYAVERRTREIGLRLALGAPAGTVRRMVVGDALKLVASALVVGVPLVLAAGYSLRAFLFGVAPYDLAALGGAGAVLTVVALVAGYVPARRAAAVDPIVALRVD
jgi:predicted permease